MIQMQHLAAKCTSMLQFGGQFGIQNNTVHQDLCQEYSLHR